MILVETQAPPVPQQHLGSSTNVLVLLVILAGVWFLRKQRTDKDGSKKPTDTSRMHQYIPWIVGGVVLYALRDSIRNTFTSERAYTLAAIAVANHVQSTRGDKTGIPSALAATVILVVIPALFA